MRGTYQRTKRPSDWSTVTDHPKACMKSEVSQFRTRGASPRQVHHFQQDSSEVEQEAHTLYVGGSSPSPATTFSREAPRLARRDRLYTARPGRIPNPKRSQRAATFSVDGRMVRQQLATLFLEGSMPSRRSTHHPVTDDADLRPVAPLSSFPAASCKWRSWMSRTREARSRSLAAPLRATNFWISASVPRV